MDGDTLPVRRRRAKIVCTLGPACDGPGGLRDLIGAGMDVARMNCAHGDHAWQARTIANVRQAAAEMGRDIAILYDLAGPKIRTGLLRDHAPVMLEDGHTIRLAKGRAMGDAGCLYTSHDLSLEVNAGEPILLNDGLIELRVEAVAAGESVTCSVVHGGELGENKGINLPGTRLSIPALTAKDLDDLHFGLEQGVDFLALSFVRNAEDIHQLRNEIEQWTRTRPGGSAWGETPIIAKLEKPQAIAELEAILDCADGVMVARGDLGVEVPLERVPGLQKHIILRARRKRVPVITATQMLESMTSHSRPTRAEVSDVANAVLDGTDALMLSGETAAGQFPREAVATMSRIIVETESIEATRPGRQRREQFSSISESIAESVAHAAEHLSMVAIAVYTKTGATARLVGAYRPPCPIYGLASDARSRRRLALYWGVTPLESPEILSTDEMLGKAERRLLDLRLANAGDVIAVVSGAPYNVAGNTNLMKIVEVGG
jgi:pyruvate kinase